ncbi:MAG TPA: TolC family protein [Gemmatimonadaceae bacterium]|nr:TolC family protein [Gemmatimonadaceae bacterium]
MKTRFVRLAVGFLVAAPVLAASRAAAQDAEPRPISLADAVALAQRNAPAAIQALGAVRNGRAQVTSSLSQFLPSIGLRAGMSKSSGATYFQGQLVPFEGDPWSQSRGYGASLVLFDAGQRWFNYRAAQTGLEASEESRISQNFSVAFSVKQQYFAVLAARESRAAADRQLEQAEQQLRVSTTRVQMGAVARTDSLRSAILVGNARVAIIAAQAALDDANVALTRLVGTPYDVTAVAADTSAVPAMTMPRDSLLAMATHGPGVRAAEAQLAAAKMSRRAAKTTYLPTISASYNFSTGRTSPDFTWGDGPGSRNTNLSLGANYTLFGGYQREQQLVQATVAEDNAEAQLRDAKAAARQNLLQFYNAFRNADETVRLQTLQVAVAEEDLQAQQQRYAAGASALVDLLTAQTTLANARTALITARAQARTAKAQLETVVGRELP